MDRKAIDELASRNLLRPVQPSPDRATRFMKMAREDLIAAPKIAALSAEHGYQAAYDAAFKATLALLAVHGHRLAAVEQRKTAVAFCRALLPASLAPALAAYDKMRQRRNDLTYEGGTVSDTDAAEAARQAGQLIDAIGREVDAELARLRKKP